MATGTVEWVPDDQVSECPLCTRRFSTTKRKHHCRACGRVVCGSCSGNQLYLPSYQKEERVCDRCFDLLRHDKGRPMNESMMENKQLEASLKSDLREKQQQEEWFRSFLLKVRGDAGDAAGSEPDSSSEGELRALLAGARNRWTEACARAGRQKMATEELQSRCEELERECVEKQEAIAKLSRAIKTTESNLKVRPKLQSECEQLSRTNKSLQQELDGLRQRTQALEAHLPTRSSSFQSFLSVGTSFQLTRMEECRYHCRRRCSVM
ncbi:Rufy1 [Symbiodinium natans]|uniref:Rufy1 protein n=1 Tax=Symbiodinium natans TaxID=878477 RepID=A0A812KA53_9DINO|nr:Rufy1 [Symbiodinium natans]